MSKKPRPQYEDAIYHVTCRGNARQTIHLTDMDRELLVSLIGGAVKRCDWQLYAYCLMNNHYHLLVRTPEANIAKGMHYINMMYARIFNQRHELSGHLFDVLLGARGIAGAPGGAVPLHRPQPGARRAVPSSRSMALVELSRGAGRGSAAEVSRPRCDPS